VINNRPLIIFHSSLFLLLQVIITPVYACVALLTFPFPPLVRYRIISGWTKIMIFLARIICGIDYRVLGRENIPNEPCVVLSKHQSAWETLAFQSILPPQVWVLKKELLYIPFFGWGLALMSPIAIDRKSAGKALKQVLDQGQERLRSGFCVVIFPEGTRMKPGIKGKYRAGGAQLAIHTETPILPIAHNAGELWPRNAFLKYPGTITVSIGKPIRPSSNLDAGQLMQKVESWIENEMLNLHKPNE
jgi:1-acyl-sn-glycerol-3-phosphate acyltransferase